MSAMHPKRPRQSIAPTAILARPHGTGVGVGGVGLGGGRIGWRVGIWLGMLLFSLHSAPAQTVARGRPCDGSSAFVVVDRQTGQTVTRGWTTPDGTLGPGLVLGPNRDFVFVFVKPGAGLIGELEVRTGPSGSTLTVPPTPMGTSIDRDSDGDGLTDEIEAVFGTNPRNPFTAGAGVGDFALVNTPPLAGPPVGSGFPAAADNPAFGPPGVVSSLALAGTCVDVSAFSDLLAVACLDRGVALLNIFGGGTPRWMATLDTPGEARAVSISDTDLAVADGAGGLVVVDASDPASASIRHQVALGGYAQAVAASAGMAYVGLRTGRLSSVELATGRERQRQNLGPEPVHDVVVSGGWVWVLRGQDLLVFASGRGGLVQVGQVRLSSLGPDPLSGRKRLMVGGGWAYPSVSSGFDVVDVRLPSAMRVVGWAVPGGPGSFKQVVANGSGLGVAVFGVNPRLDGTHHVALYDLADPTQTETLLTILPTPGTAYAHTLDHGLSYVADGERGLQVVRYVASDVLGLAPTVDWETEPVGGRVEEGQPFRVGVMATDDVQVRDVEFYVDGVRRMSDGSFPFETVLVAPSITPGRTRVTLRARAMDTGGNATWSEPLVLELVADRTPPEWVGGQPRNGEIVGQVTTLTAWFSEALLPSTVTAETFRLTSTGRDGIPGNADDPPVPAGVLSTTEDGRGVRWRFSSPLPEGGWRVTVGPPLSDLAGNIMPTTDSWTFRTFDQPDQDADGLPDDREAALGLDPGQADSRGDGIRDGDRDLDRDGLAGGWEVYWGLDPGNARSLVSNVLDGDLDVDADGLPHRLEAEEGTHPGLADTDQDGWNDESEVTGGSNPLDRLSTPRLWVVTSPKLGLGLPARSEAGGISGWGTQRASPPISISVPALESGPLGRAQVLARPRVGVGLAAGVGTEGTRAMVVGLPVVRVGLGGHMSGPDTPSTTVAQPRVRIDWNP
jgi:hypothetical protein